MMTLKQRNCVKDCQAFPFFPINKFIKLPRIFKIFFIIEKDIIPPRASQCPDQKPISLREHMIHVHTLLSLFEDYN